MGEEMEKASELTHDLSIEACYKILRHSQTYPSNFIFGALIGVADSQSVKIQEAVPIFHSNLLQPSVAIAMSQVEIYSKKRGLRVHGIYFASEFSEDEGVPEPVNNLAKTLDKFYKTRFLVIRLNPPNKKNKDITFNLYTTSEDDDIRILSESCKINSTHLKSIKEMTKLQENISGKKYINDFESHMEDVNIEWLDLPRNLPKYDYVDGLFAKNIA